MFFAVLVQPILAQGFDHPQLIKTLKDLVPSCNNFSSLWIRAAFHDAGTFMRGYG